MRNRGATSSNGIALTALLRSEELDCAEAGHLDGAGHNGRGAKHTAEVKRAVRFVCEFQSGLASLATLRWASPARRSEESVSDGARDHGARP
jgi:hypothetical protein